MAVQNRHSHNINITQLLQHLSQKIKIFQSSYTDFFLFAKCRESVKTVIWSHRLKSVQTFYNANQRKIMLRCLRGRNTRKIFGRMAWKGKGVDLLQFEISVLNFECLLVAAKTVTTACILMS